jgi:UDPglucose 6-dehydrogenase
VKIGVFGLWHLGCVTAAALAKLGHQVTGSDEDAARVELLRRGQAPVLEPGLDALLQRGLGSGRLDFAGPPAEAMRHVELLWIAADTPVDDSGHAAAGELIESVERLLPTLAAARLVVVSSQLPAGSVRQLERAAARDPRTVHIGFACCPENLRLGSAIGDFLHPARIIAGVRSAADRDLLQPVLDTIGAPIEWMSIESAEMTKHAINAFLAASVTFANELAMLCEAAGADAKEVERGLKTDARIGMRAYLAPGDGFSGGTLERDLAFLSGAAQRAGVPVPLLESVQLSNALHRKWVQQKLTGLFGNLAHTTVAVWGLTYKPGTDTLRRSPAVELCDWMLHQGARVHVHDPAVRQFPERWSGSVLRFEQPLEALRHAQALVMATAWPVYHGFSREQLLECSEPLVVLDANHVMPQLLGSDGRLTYIAVGRNSLPGAEA